MSKKSMAERIAERFGDDGQQWHDSDGTPLVDVCRAEGADVDVEERCVTYRFDDGSAIVVCDGGWDLAAGPDCSCWAGVGHHEGCPEYDE